MPIRVHRLLLLPRLLLPLPRLPLLPLLLLRRKVLLLLRGSAASCVRVFS